MNVKRDNRTCTVFWTQFLPQGKCSINASCLFGDLGQVTLCKYPNFTKKMKSVIAPK